MDGAHSPRTVLVTGGAGFIGGDFIEFLAGPAGAGLHVVNLDSLTYAADTKSLAAAVAKLGDRYRFVRADIRDRAAVAAVFEAAQPDTVVHFAAESHVDRSIDNPLDFVETNVVGTANLLAEARRQWGARSDIRFHHISTDEVYGSLGPDGLFTEDTPYAPSSPYSASKAASDHLVRAWHRTYGLPATISNCSNNYGPRQFPEKLIPLMIAKALAGQPLPVYGDGANVRDWLYVRDHCEAIWTVVRQGVPGRTYNIGGDSEYTNIALVHLLCDILQELAPPASGRYRDLVTFVPDRPGHDRRYAMDHERLTQELGWRPRHTFREGLRLTVQWYLDNRRWLETINQEKYDGGRLGMG